VGDQVQFRELEDLRAKGQSAREWKMRGWDAKWLCETSLAITMHMTVGQGIKWLATEENKAIMG